MIVASEAESKSLLAFTWLTTLPSDGRITMDSTGKLEAEEKEKR